MRISTSLLALFLWQQECPVRADPVVGRQSLRAPEPVSSTAAGGATMPVLSSDGRYLFFLSQAGGHGTAGPGRLQAFRRDLTTGTVQLVSALPDGRPSAGDTFEVVPNSDGRWAAFASEAPGFDAGDTNGIADLFLVELAAGTPRRITSAPDGGAADGPSELRHISPDGRWILFESLASNLTVGDTNGAWDIFLWDRQSRVTELISVATNGFSAGGDSGSSVMTPDARWVVFESEASNLALDDVSNATSRDIYLRDRQSGSTRLISRRVPGAVMSDCLHPRISPDGSRIVFAGPGARIDVAASGRGAHHVWERETDTLIQLTAAAPPARFQFPAPAVFSANSRWLAFAENGVVQVWESESRLVSPPFTDPSGGLRVR